MEVTKWLKPSGSVSRIDEPRLPLWVKSGSPTEVTECLLLGVKRTSSAEKQTFKRLPILMPVIRSVPACGLWA